MNIHNFSSYFVLKSSFNAAPTNATQNGVAVDTLGYRRAAVVADIVTGAATTVKLTVSESADGSTNWLVVSGSTQPGTAQAASLPASGVAGQPYIIDIDLSKRLRYLRVNVVGTGTAGSVVADILLFQAFTAANAEDFTAVSI